VDRTGSLYQRRRRHGLPTSDNKASGLAAALVEIISRHNVCSDWDPGDDTPMCSLINCLGTSGSRAPFFPKEGAGK
jgi:hypothetical protein